MAADKAFMVAYDVTRAERVDYDNIEAALKKFGEVVEHSQGSVRWLHKSEATAQQIREAVVAAAPQRKMTVWVAQAAADRSFS